MDSTKTFRQPNVFINETSGRIGFPSSSPNRVYDAPTDRLREQLTVSGELNAEAYRLLLQSAMAPIATELLRVEAVLKSELQTGNSSIREMLDYVGELGGKRLRPCLLLLAAKACGEPTEESVRLSVVVEMVHTATLVHDDVLDKALVRRHKQTVHERWDVPTSILIGDWLFAHAYGLANRGSSTIPGRWIADAAKQVCEGEILQGQSIRHFEIGIEEYIQLLEAKTGALCAVSCSLGAWSGGGDETACHRLQRFGLKLGTAFQVYDDWLDVWGDQDHAGKTLGTDLGSFKPTLPALRALNSMANEDRLRLVNSLNQGNEDALVELQHAIAASDASNFTLAYAKRLIAEAMEQLDALPESEAAVSLRKLALASVSRKG
jgi:octaprenyl-diphosphate synthase